jgi:MFS family permease
MYSSWGMINPIMAVFITEQLKDGSLAVVGISTSIYFITNGLLQLPVAAYIDKIKGEKDDYRAVIFGSSLVSLTAFLYLFVNYSWQVYVVQIISAVGGAISYPAWTAIFSRHLDRNREGFEWSFYNSIVGFGSALTASIGTIIALWLGYRWLFFIVGFFSIVSNLLLFFISKDLNKKADNHQN